MRFKLLYEASTATTLDIRQTVGKEENLRHDFVLSEAFSLAGTSLIPFGNFFLFPMINSIKYALNHINTIFDGILVMSCMHEKLNFGIPL